MMDGKTITMLILSQIASHGGWIWYNHGLPDDPLAVIPIAAFIAFSGMCGIEIQKNWN